jgi:flagellar biosynthetic protein FlhB
MSDQRTEAPTPRRLAQARHKGEGVGRSHELSMTLSLGAGTVMLMTLLPSAAARIGDSIVRAIADVGARDLPPQLMLSRAGAGFAELIAIILPLAVVCLIAGVAGQIASGGLVFATGAIRFDMNRMNPIQGLRRIVDRQALVRLVIAAAKLILLAGVSWQVVGNRIPALVALDGATAPAITRAALAAVLELGLTMTILMAGIALADLVIQRRRATNSLKMSKEDVRREAQEQDGDPHVKAARKRRARQLAFARMMDAVPTADVIVVNPIRLAIALKYDSSTMKAPKMVAKGQRLMAARIRDLAREHDVPIVEDVPLARALFSRPIGSDVPAHLYRAVARILVLVHQARATPRPVTPINQPGGSAG